MNITDSGGVTVVRIINMLIFQLFRTLLELRSIFWKLITKMNMLTCLYSRAAHQPAGRSFLAPATKPVLAPINAKVSRARVDVYFVIYDRMRDC